MENRNGLIVDADLTQTNGLAERQAAQQMIALNVTPHVAQNDTNRRSAIDRRITAWRLCGEPAEEKAHRRVVRLGKTIGGLARPMFRGIDRLRSKFTLTMASYNLIRIPKLLATAT